MRLLGLQRASTKKCCGSSFRSPHQVQTPSARQPQAQFDQKMMRTMLRGSSAKMRLAHGLHSKVEYPKLTGHGNAFRPKNDASTVLV